MGHEFVVPMREFTPPPPPPPGETPPPTLPSPTAYATLMIRPASGVDGGTVVSWKSLDHGGPMLALLEEDLHEDWAQMHLYSRRHGSYYFFILHTGQLRPAPVDQPSLGLRDAALITELESSFPEMNQLVATSAALVRNSPPPAPVAPGPKKFWRIRADWTVDTDGDESPDWAEFEIAGNSLHPSYYFADAFVADTDGNGIADGKQTDLDQDGTVDAQDSGIADDLATQALAPLPRYAVFPVSRPTQTGVVSPPISINNRGTVLWPDGCWTDGTWLPLTMTSPNLVTVGAAGQNDIGEIVGNGLLTIQAQLYGLAPVAVRWESPNAVPTAILLEGTGEEAGKFFHGLIAGNAEQGPLLSNDGRIIVAPTFYFEDSTSGLAQGLVDDGNPSIWTLPGNGRTATRATIAHGFAYPLDGDTYWGVNDQTGQVMLKAPGDPPPPDRAPRNLVRTSTGQLHAFYNVASPKILKDGAWNTSTNLLNGLDMSSDGTAIAERFGSTTVAPIRLNGYWKPIANSIPGANDWKDDTVSLLDTTAGGWILAKRGAAQSPAFGALLPLRVKGNCEVDGTVLQDAVGVDDFSIGSTDPGTAVGDKIWIMAPSHGGETQVKVFAPIHETCPVELSGTGIEFNGAGSVVLTQPETIFTVKATNATPAGNEIPLVIKLGTGKSVQSLSSPISFKTMKQRTVKVRVWKVRSDAGNLPSLDPTKEEIDNYLNKIYTPQINAIFDCSIETIGPLNYDNSTAIAFGAPPNQSPLPQPGNGTLDFTTNFMGEMSNIRTGGRAAELNINLYIVGGTHWVESHRWNPEKSKLETLKAKAIANNDNNTMRECWVSGESTTEPEGLWTIAHEIGHILFGDGHPEDGGGDAPLPGTPKPPRLMCSDPKLGAIGGARRLTVKGEWDHAVGWFQKEIDANRMDP